MWGTIILMMLAGAVLAIVDHQQEEAQKIELKKRPGTKLIKVYIYIFLISLVFIVIYLLLIK